MNITHLYLRSFSIDRMLLSYWLNGSTPLNLKDAVFAVENAYFEGMLNKSNYEKNISQMATIARLKAIQDGLNWNNPIPKHIQI